MKLAKSLLLGSAAALAAVTGASAADLPSRKAAPVEYVRVCSAYGAGFFYIPGTDTCLRIGGRVRAEFGYVEPFGRGENATGFRGRGRIFVDARTQTGYGTLRTFIRYEIQRQTGALVSGTQQRVGNAQVPVGGIANPQLGNAQTNATVDAAFIQFAGLTIGRAASFYDFYANSLDYIGLTGSSQSNQNLIAYTAVLGGGFSATISVEDGVDRRQAWARLPSGTLAAPSGLNAQNFYGGQRLPDIVAALRVDQPWGSAQLSGAIHQLFSANTAVQAGGILGVPGVAAFNSTTEYGYAVQAGVKINMPFIAPGDQLWLQAAYAQGAISYIASGYLGGANLGGAGTNSLIGLGSGLIAADAVTVATGNGGSATEKGRGFSLVAAFLHYWTPTIRQAIFAGYTQWEYPSIVNNTSIFTGGPVAAAPVGQQFGYPDFRVYQVGTNLIWSPVKDLDVGVELLYNRVDPRGRVLNLNPGGVGGFTTATAGSTDNYQVRVRVQRDF